MSRRGASLVELVVAMAVFGFFLLIIAALSGEFRRADETIRFAWFRHPETISIATRIRRDILASSGYPSAFQGMEQEPTRLILDAGPARTIVWTFGEIVQRDAWQGSTIEATWKARAAPAFSVDAWETPNGETGVRLIGRDGNGGLIVDQLVIPRAR